MESNQTVNSINRSINSEAPLRRHLPRHFATAAFATAFLCWSPAIGQTDSRTIAIAKSGCAQAAQYQPASDVAYQPGRDQQGRAVVPADIDDGRLDPFRESITVIISSELEKRFGIPHHSVLFDADALIGVVEVRLADGRLTFNGVPLDDSEARALSELCRSATGRP